MGLRLVQRRKLRQACLAWTAADADACSWLGLPKPGPEPQLLPGDGEGVLVPAELSEILEKLLIMTNVLAQVALALRRDAGDEALLGGRAALASGSALVRGAGS